MAFCKQCGASLKEGIKFCTACGKAAAPSSASVENVIPPSVTEKLVEKVAQPDAVKGIPVQAAREKQSLPASSSANATGQNRVVVISAVVVTAVLLAGATWAYINLYATPSAAPAPLVKQVVPVEPTKPPPLPTPATPLPAPAPVVATPPSPPEPSALAAQPPVPPKVAMQPAKPPKAIGLAAPSPTTISTANNGVVGDMLADAEACMAKKKYDCAIANAKSALRIAPTNSGAKSLLQRAEAGQKQALESITIN